MFESGEKDSGPAGPFPVTKPPVLWFLSQGHKCLCPWAAGEKWVGGILVFPDASFNWARELGSDCRLAWPGRPGAS